MKATGGPQKLRFAIHSCSGEDPDFPARELLFHSTATQGWQSPRFCKYPQEIVLKLDKPAKLSRIQTLSHEFKIATKIEVFVGLPDSGTADSNTLKRLGYLSFDDNEKSGHRARELKNVHLDVAAYFVRFVVHRCFVNKYNIYNQVGIVAINLVGEYLSAPPADSQGYLDINPAPMSEQPYYNQAAMEVADLNLDVHVDSLTAAKIRELVRAKEQAVAAEDYDEAKRLKFSIERLKVVGQKIAQLEARKRAAVEKEDYDLAKGLKLDIDKLRAAGETTATTAAAGDTGAKGVKNPDDIFNRVLGKGRSAGSMRGTEDDRTGPALPLYEPESAGQDIPHSPQLSREPSESRRVSNGGVQNSPRVSGEPPPSPPAGLGRPLSAAGDNGYGGGEGKSRFHAYDDRPARGRGEYDAVAELSRAAPAQPSSRRTSGRVGAQSSDEVGDDDSLPAPPGWPGDLPSPEPLPSTATKDAEAVSDLAGEYVSRALLSRNWQLRDAALQYLAAGAGPGGALASRREAGRVLARAAQRGLKDKVPNVFHSALPLLAVALELLAGGAGGARDVAAAVEQCLPLVLEKLGDNNARIRDRAKDLLMELAGMKDSGLRGMTSQLLKPVKSQTAWRPVLGMLNVLQELVPAVGLGSAGGPRGGAAAEGFDLAELMEWVGRTFNSPNADVRAAAVKVTVVVFDLAGPAVRRYLPKDLNPKIKEQLDAAFGGGAAEMQQAPPRTPPAAAAPERRAAAPKPRAGAGAGAGSGGPAPGKAAGAGAPRKGAAAPAQPAPPPPPAAPLDDDPASFEADLRARERQYGREHPAVAESCSTLAIMYNQRGDYSRAQPLYERALAIYEKVYGMEHADVAHTLTDLAVLHLEQGRDELGRPLLERALAIQEKALGPDHPDVVAIRDVLNSE